ncbi:hypothetical protein [Pedobacter africanus]|uniref:Uncharacterized protein n=1 Tax=Pedobacter africanus TaxID=151894 RepID=A0A1W1ZY37_9SPHI|nr:hypothetical protein [Pedobacter africanus]SMC53122.1 hypothetical protein SAMN04488524_1055 [Pedobacter africanus]
MKYIQCIILFTFFFISYNTKAQHVGTISEFEILPAYLTNGQVRISSGTTTTLKYKVTFVRETATTYPTLTWKPFNMTVGLSTADANGNIVVLEDGTKIFGDNLS